MPKFRKKPIVIEAYQTPYPKPIETLEGTMMANIGDWIITGVNGEQYPCKPDIFAKSYEPVDGVSPSAEADAFRRGAEAMREAVLQRFKYHNRWTGDEVMDELRCVPMPEPPDSGGGEA